MIRFLISFVCAVFFLFSWTDVSYGQTTFEEIMPDSPFFGGDGGNPGMQLPRAGGGAEEEDLDLFSDLDGPQKTAAEIEDEIREEAFNAALTGLFPLRPEEIRRLLEHYDKTQQAVETPVYPEPTAELVVETIPLDPGSPLSTIKVAVGHVTTVAAVDVTGAPWPILDATWGGNFEVITPEGYTDPGSLVDPAVVGAANTIRITPLAPFANGNISLRLLGLMTPVVLKINTSRDVVHYRFDARIPDYGPNSVPPLIEGGISIVAGSPTVNAILDGVPPSSAEKLEVTGVDGRTSVYTYNDNTYVRTPLTLLSPGWSSSASSADGMSVYQLGNASVLLLSDNGKVVRARVTEKDDSNE
jgi:intracellular multiplication protein IcmK